MSATDATKLYLEENAVRIVAAQVVIVSSVVLITQWEYLALLLAIDFALRAFTALPSPLALLAKLIVNKFGWKKNPIFAPPKKFAAAIGFAFSLSIFILFLIGQDIAAYAVGGVLVFCAVLESVFQICLGCYAYDWFVAPFKN